MPKHYNEQFKSDGLEYRKNHPQLSVSAVCRNLGISPPTYYQWKNSAEENDGQVNHVESGNYASDLEKEIARLKRELKNSQDALKILKKAMGILAKEEH